LPVSESRYPTIFDGHNDTVLSLMSTGRSFLERSDQGHIDLPRALEGGLGGGFFAVFVMDPVAEVDSRGSRAGQRCNHTLQRRGRASADDGA
jgi:microsomal dipeptidase-like Zn-dependent dipeptidase